MTVVDAGMCVVDAGSVNKLLQTSNVSAYATSVRRHIKTAVDDAGVASPTLIGKIQGHLRCSLRPTALQCEPASTRRR
ncbi:hypothetical protein HanIR_Chr01g0021841 [Helianthus annuus]|nr:hypothetical protein HanIR_Chr01g0021841 [Helianthus annuus]